MTECDAPCINSMYAKFSKTKSSKRKQVSVILQHNHNTTHA